MATRDWMGPLILGVTAALAAALFSHFSPAPATPTGTLVAPFEGASGFEGDGFDAMLVAVGDVHAAKSGVQGVGNASWHEAVGYVHSTILGTGRSRDSGFLQTNVSEAGPRFGFDGYNATQATIYVFFANGNLLASNADEGNVSRFTRDSRFRQIGHEVWYLGDSAETPDGTTRLPGSLQPILSQMRPHLVGMSEGGVHSMLIAQYPGSMVLGELHVTVRIDRLVLAH